MSKLNRRYALKDIIGYYFIATNGATPPRVLVKDVIYEEFPPPKEGTPEFYEARLIPRKVVRVLYESELGLMQVSIPWYTFFGHYAREDWVNETN